MFRAQLLERLKKGQVNEFRHFLALFRLTSEFGSSSCAWKVEDVLQKCCCCSHIEHRAHPRSIQSQLSHVRAFTQSFAFQHCQNTIQAAPERHKLRNDLYNPLLRLHHSTKAFPLGLRSPAMGFAELFADCVGQCSFRHIFNTFHSRPKPTEALCLCHADHGRELPAPTQTETQCSPLLLQSRQNLTFLGILLPVGCSHRVHTTSWPWFRDYISPSC